MTYTLQLPLFALRTLLQSDYLAWLVGLPILLFAVVMLVVQYRRHRQLTHDLKLLDKMQLHSRRVRLGTESHASGRLPYRCPHIYHYF